MTFRITLAQVSTSEEKKENLKKGLELIAVASETGSDMLILPELFMAYVSLDSPPETIVEGAEEVGGEFVSRMALEARKRGIHVVFGITERSKKRDKVHNTVVMLGPDGHTIATHRKFQLFDSFGYKESSRFEPGADLDGTFRTSLGVMGLMTCYELRFPEIARILAMQGAQMIVVPTAWVAGRMKEEHLHTLAKSRALENTVFLAVCSQTGRIFTGRSLVVDPFGVSICDAGEEEGLTTVQIDLERVKRVRELLPSLGHTRTEEYARLMLGRGSVRVPPSSSSSSSGP